MTVIAIDRTIEIANEPFGEYAAACSRIRKQSVPGRIYLCAPASYHRYRQIDAGKAQIHSGEVYPIIFVEVVAEHDDGTFGGCTAFVHEVSKKDDVCHKGENNISRDVLDAHLTHWDLVGPC